MELMPQGPLTPEWGGQPAWIRQGRRTGPRRATETTHVRTTASRGGRKATAQQTALCEQAVCTQRDVSKTTHLGCPTRHAKPSEFHHTRKGRGAARGTIRVVDVVCHGLARPEQPNVVHRTNRRVVADVHACTFIDGAVVRNLHASTAARQHGIAQRGRQETMRKEAKKDITSRHVLQVQPPAQHKHKHIAARTTTISLPSSLAS